MYEFVLEAIGWSWRNNSPLAYVKSGGNSPVNKKGIQGANGKRREPVAPLARRV